MDRTPTRSALALAAAALLALSPATMAKGGKPDKLPSFITGEVIATVYDGVTDDLLTGGLGASGLQAAAPPPFADPLNPSAAELRTAAIHGNYRALVDTTTGGGFGRFFGPNVLADGTVTGGEGLIAGTETLAFAGPRSGKVNVTLMVQVPDSFDPANACIVTAPSSGSRGIYGAIGTAGEWGLKNGCAVAYTDKGTGTGAHDLADDTVGLIDGLRADADAAGKDSTFTAPVGRRAQARFNAEFPERFAFKHAHSEQNPEADWGSNVLQSIEFAFWVLNERFGEKRVKGSSGKRDKDRKDDDGGSNDGGEARRFMTPANTIVIASSVSNGGGASVRAAEQDERGLIDGVAVSEPNVNPRFEPGFAIVQGDGPPLFDHSRSLYDYTTILNVYQSCASADPAAISDDVGDGVAPPNDPSLFNLPPLNTAPSPAACQSLRDKGLLDADDLPGQAAEAQAAINGAGILVEQNVLMPSHWAINVPQAVAVTYANSYSRSSVLDTVCAYSFGATAAGTGEPVALGAAAEAALFATSNGIPPTGGVNLINNDAPGGPRENRVSTPDQNLDGALCLRALEDGVDPASGAKLRGAAKALSRAVRNGIRQIRANGDLRGKPAIFVTGRADAILPPNHTSRAYFGLNRTVEGAGSNLRYVEVLNAQHLDVLNSLIALGPTVPLFSGFAARYVPLHHYFNQALDLMLDHLRNDTPLPGSQVVRTVRRGYEPSGQVPDLELANIPEIATVPAAADAIVFAGGEVRIPD